MLAAPTVISIHAPPRGATRRFFPVHPCRCNFNSRPSARGDHSLNDKQQLHLISIHAPPRGATRTRMIVAPLVLFQFTPLREGRLATWRKSSCSRTYFNSRPSARGDLIVCDDVVNLNISIHAPPRGATYPEHLHSAGRFDFNSRPSARGDRYCFRESRATSISIHAPPRGATKQLTRLWKPTVFQFTPLREGRRAQRWNRLVEMKFQFTPLREGRRASRTATSAFRAFQFTPLREGRRSRSARRVRPSYFNSRPSARGDSSSVGIISA